MLGQQQRIQLPHPIVQNIELFLQFLIGGLLLLDHVRQNPPELAMRLLQITQFGSGGRYGRTGSFGLALADIQKPV